MRLCALGKIALWSERSTPTTRLGGAPSVCLPGFDDRHCAYFSLTVLYQRFLDIWSRKLYFLLSHSTSSDKSSKNWIKKILRHNGRHFGAQGAPTVAPWCLLQRQRQFRLGETGPAAKLAHTSDNWFYWFTGVFARVSGLFSFSHRTESSLTFTTVLEWSHRRRRNRARWRRTLDWFSISLGSVQKQINFNEPVGGGAFKC